MSKEHTSLPMQSLSVDEKYSQPSVGTPGASGMGASANGGILPGGNSNSTPKKTIHPAVIISLWISLSSSVIVYNA